MHRFQLAHQVLISHNYPTRVPCSMASTTAQTQRRGKRKHNLYQCSRRVIVRGNRQYYPAGDCSDTNFVHSTQQAPTKA